VGFASAAAAAGATSASDLAPAAQFSQAGHPGATVVVPDHMTKYKLVFLGAAASEPEFFTLSDPTAANRLQGIRLLARLPSSRVSCTTRSTTTIWFQTLPPPRQLPSQSATYCHPLDPHHVTVQATIGIDFLSKSISVKDRTLRLQLWDTAGQVGPTILPP
jgi:hypothetical protein